MLYLAASSVGKNKANFRCGRREAPPSPFVPLASRVVVVQTNPISAGMLPQYSTIPSFQRSSPGSPVQTKPIRRRRPETDAVGGSPQGQPRQTNPISRRRAGGASVLWKRSYGELDMQQTSAKQSQLGLIRFERTFELKRVDMPTYPKVLQGLRIGVRHVHELIVSWVWDSRLHL